MTVFPYVPLEEEGSLRQSHVREIWQAYASEFCKATTRQDHTVRVSERVALLADSRQSC